MLSRRDLDVLIVDDNDNDAELSIYSLRRLDRSLSILRVKDGEQALDFLFLTGMFRTRPPGNPRLLLLDLEMPRIPGLEVLKRVRGSAQTRNMPVVMFSSCSNAIAVDEAYALGVSRYVTKPAAFDEYRAQVGDIGQEWLFALRPHLTEDPLEATANLNPRSNDAVRATLASFR